MIRKTAFLVTGTVTGLVAVLSYNPPHLSNAIAASGTSPLPDTNSNTGTTPAQPQPSATESATPAKATPKDSPSTQRTNSSQSNSSTTETQSTPSQTPTPTASQTTKQSSGSSGTFKGDTSQTRWGPVQVQITVQDGKITDVSTLQYPNGDRRSLMISQQVIPWLQQEALRVQTANISGIGGATYTSTGFRNSLASAIQKAGI